MQGARIVTELASGLSTSDWIAGISGIGGALLGALVGWWLSLISIRRQQLKDDVELAIAKTTLALGAIHLDDLLADSSQEKLSSLQQGAVLDNARDALAMVQARHANKRIRDLARTLDHDLLWAQKNTLSWYRQYRADMPPEKAVLEDLYENAKRDQATARAHLDELRGTRTKAIVKKVRPREGSQSGGETITLIGRGFKPLFRRTDGSAVRVLFDATPLPPDKVRFITRRKIIATTPHGVGRATVTVDVPQHQQAKPSPDTFSFRIPPTVDSINPAEGKRNTRVIISGANLTNVSSVTFGNRKAKNVSFQPNGQSLSATVPRGKRGRQARVRVSTPGGSADIKFLYDARSKTRLESWLNSLVAGLRNRLR